MTNDFETLSELESNSKPVPEFNNISVDEAIAEDYKGIHPTHCGKFTEATTDRIIACLEKGISLNTACMAAGIDGKTARNWYKKGMAEYEALTDDQLASVDTIDELLSQYGMFYLNVNRAKSRCVVEIHDMLYERCFENNKEWIATYILEREEPEKYNLKYRVSADVNSSATTKSTVEFSFRDGFETRTDEEKEYINTKLDELDEQYKNSSSAPKKDQ